MGKGQGHIKGQGDRISRRRFVLGGSALLAGAAASELFYRQPRALVVEEVSLATAKVPPGRELRMVQLSDLHMRHFGSYQEKVVRTVNQLAPELILLTGDYVERHRTLEGLRDFCRELVAPGGIFAVQGNWEYWARLEGQKLRQNLADVGARLLINERADLVLGDLPVSILGLDYPSPADHLRVLLGAADSSRLNLLLSHVPAFDHSLLGSAADLVLCGHTHGGQVRLPLLPPLVRPRFTGRFSDGLYRVGDRATPLYVNRGVGTSALPIRFLCPPEVTLITLKGLAQSPASSS